MPIYRPTLQTLISRARADIESRLPGSDAHLRRSMLDVLAVTHAGAMHGLYGFAANMFKQFFVDTADGDFLDRHASMWGLTRKAATPSTCARVYFTGFSFILIPAGTVIQRSDGAQYSTDSDVNIEFGSAIVPVTSLKAGADYNTPHGAAFTLVSTIELLSSTAFLLNDSVGGADLESDDALRDRLLQRIRARATGGNAQDYITWALEVAGVTRAWSYPLEYGQGTVAIRFMMDDSYADGIPLAADITAVQNYINSVKPVGAWSWILAPIAKPINPEISITPNTTAVKNAVETQLKDWLASSVAPGDTIALSKISEIISLSEGEDSHVLISPTDTITHDVGEIATLGTITWS